MAESTRRDGGSDLLRVALIIVAIVVGFPLVMMAVFAPMMGTWMFADGHMGAGTWGGSWLAVLGMTLLPLLLLVAAAAYLLRALGGGAERTDPALEELRRAYARGDLSDEEYERRRERLRD